MCVCVSVCESVRDLISSESTVFRGAEKKNFDEFI